MSVREAKTAAEAQAAARIALAAALGANRPAPVPAPVPMRKVRSACKHPGRICGLCSNCPRRR